jgi:hypothetical protein
MTFYDSAENIPVEFYDLYINYCKNVWVILSYPLEIGARFVLPLPLSLSLSLFFKPMKGFNNDAHLLVHNYF